jgi:hypothetical protein
MKNRMKIVIVIAILLLVGYVVSEHFNKKESNQKEITIVEEELKEIEEQPKEKTVTIETKASKKTSSSTKKVVKKKKKVVKKKKDTTTKKISYNKDSLKSYAHDLVISYGWTEKDYNALVKIINHESGWRVTAENKKSKAYGLCQALPASKMKSAGSDYRTNGKTQLKWCMNYIKSRYGSPSSAWAFWQKHHWY